MLPYASSFGLRNGIGTVPNTLMMNLPQNSTPTLLTQQNQVPLSISVNNNLINKDSQWLTLEVCREHQRGLCPRSELECKYAHPPPYLETTSGRVVCCYDSIKGKCHRVKPPCKYLHPPQHLKDILIQNGKNNLLMKNLQLNIIQQQLSALTPTQSRLGGLIPMNSKFVSEGQISPITEPIVTTSNNDHSYSNYYHGANDVSTVHHGINLSSECQNTKFPSNPVSSGAHASVSVVAPVTLSNDNIIVGKKRSLTQMYQNGYQSEVFVQQPPSDEEPVPVKRPILSESNLSALTLNRDQQLNTMGYVVNPFMTYQNPLATYMAINNQSGLQHNGFSVPNIMTNTHQFQSLGPSFLCASPQVGVNNLSLMANMQNQQQLAMILNSLQGNRTLPDFMTFK